MKTYHPALISWLLILLLSFAITDALAKKPIKDNGSPSGKTTDSSCLSNKEINDFAKQWFPTLQADDPAITLTDVKNAIKTVGDCVTIESAAQVLTDYRAVQNTPPTISGTPSDSVAEARAYHFAPTASDADGDPLTFNILNQPAWASFNITTGVLSGTPSYEDADTYTDIQISVTDGSETALLPAFSIMVTDTNRAPVISGTPTNSLTEGMSYSFTPEASDSDGDILIFTILNQPSWADFDTATGTLLGTPTESEYQDITINVSDGTETVSLPTFSILVKPLPITSSTVNLSWTAPSSRTDSSPLDLSEIGGYCVYMGTSRDNLNMIVDIHDGSTLSYSIENLGIGNTYYFAVTTYDIYDNHSSFSEIVAKSTQ